MVLIFLLIAVFFAALIFVYRLAFYSREKGRSEDMYDIPDGEQYQAERGRMRRLIDDFAAVPCERVKIRSFDGLELSARFYPGKPGAPVEIQMHGYRGSAIRDFCGGAKIGLSQGHNILLPDQRAHGASEGRTISFGVNERRDVLSWIGYARARLGADVPVLLVGVSMGAATVLMTAGMDELPANVRGVVADCPYSSPAGIIRKVVREDMHLPAGLMMPLVRASARIFGGFSVDEASPIAAVKRMKVPALIIHGAEDRFVPCGMSREMEQANPSLVRLEVFPGAGHGLSYIVDERRYADAIAGFEKKINF